MRISAQALLLLAAGLALAALPGCHGHAYLMVCRALCSDVTHHDASAGGCCDLTLVPCCCIPGAGGAQLAVCAHAELLRRDEPQLHW